MLDKKYFLILLLLIVGICAISTASAADNATDTVATDDINADDIGAADDVNVDLEKNADESNDDEISATSNEDSKVAKDGSDEKLTYYMFYPDAEDYDVTFRYGTYNLVGSYKDKEIRYYLDPYQTNNIYYYKYDFRLCIYDGMTEDAEYYYWGNKVYDSGRICGNTVTERTECIITVPAKTFKAGTYYLVFYNYLDNIIMDGPNKLVVKDTAIIEASNYDAFYNSGTPLTIRLMDKSTRNGIMGDIKITFSNGVTRYLTTDKNGYASIVPPVGVGKYTVTISSNNANLNAAAIQRTATIKKAKVSVKAKKVSEYKGFKVTLKATVKSNGKNVNEGVVAFKIKGKTYKVAVRNGVAIKKLKLGKVKSYKYTAKYLGTGNLYKSKVSKAKATVKKRYGTKIIAKKLKVYSNQIKAVTIKVLTKNGKKVKNGWLKFGGPTPGKVKVKNGKARVGLYGMGNKHLRWFDGFTSSYKKVIVKKIKLRYVPISHKYKASGKKIKITSRFRCNCGKKSTHYHYGTSYSYFTGHVYKYKTDKVVIS